MDIQTGSAMDQIEPMGYSQWLPYQARLKPGTDDGRQEIIDLLVGRLVAGHSVFGAGI